MQNHERNSHWHRLRVYSVEGTSQASGGDLAAVICTLRVVPLLTTWARHVCIRLNRHAIKRPSLRTPSKPNATRIITQNQQQTEITAQVERCKQGRRSSDLAKPDGGDAVCTEPPARTRSKAVLKQEADSDPAKVPYGSVLHTVRPKKERLRRAICQCPMSLTIVGLLVARCAHDHVHWRPFGWFAT